MSFGDIIKEKRQRKGYTLQDLEKYTGIHSANLSRIERKQPSDNPTLKTMISLAASLDLVFIVMKEGLKHYDSVTKINLDDGALELDPKTKEFILDPKNQVFLRLAAIIKEQGARSYAAQAIIEHLELEGIIPISK